MAPSQSRQTFAAALEAARRARHLSIRDVARIGGVPTPTAQGWLNGRHFPTNALRPHYLRIVAELGLSGQLPDDLWGEDWDDLQPRLRTGHPPYLGLRPFRTADRDRYFGRTAETRRLATLVRDRLQAAAPGIVVLLGVSGSGKSSLLAAGLIATETVDGILAGVPVVQLAPADLRAGGLPGDPMGRTPADLAAKPAGAVARLVVIDQFEDILAGDDADQATALAAVAAQAQSAVVVLGLRADAFAAAAQQPLLAEALAHPFLVAPLTSQEVREVILGPAELAGLTVEDDLVAALLEDLAPGAMAGTVAVDALPLLSNALLATWASGTGDRLTLTDYVHAGGVGAAVQNLAEDVFGSLDAAQQEATHRLFVRLARDSGDILVRESVPLDDLDPAARPAMDAFVAARMLTVTGDAVRISHEALLSHWARLHDWIGQNRADREVTAWLGRAAGVWHDSGRSNDALIPVDRLEAFGAWFADPGRRQLLSPRETEFVDASRAHFTSALAKEQARNRQLRRGRGIAIGLTALASALALVAGVLYWQGRGLQAEADSSRLDAQSRQVALEAESMRSGDPNLAAQLSLVAAGLADTRQATSSLLDSTGANTPIRWSGPANAVIAKSPDQTLVARADGAGQVTLWRGDELTTSPGTAFVADPSGGPLYAIALTKQGRRMLLAVGGGAAAGLWDVTGTPSRISDLRDGDFTTYGAAFDSAGDLLALATSTGQVRLWSIPAAGDPVRAATLSLGPRTPAKSVAFGPGGGLFVAGGSDAVAHWRLGAAPKRLPDLRFSYGASAVISQTVAVSPDGSQLAAGLAGRRVLRWHLSGLKASALKPLLGFGSWTNDLAYSNDGTTVIVGNSDQNTYLFDAATGALREKLPCPSGVTGVEIVGDRPVSSSVDGMLRVSQADNPVLRTGASAYALTGDSQGKWLAASTLGEGIALWNTAGSWPVRVRDPDAGGAATSSAVGMAPNGGFMVAGTTDGSVLSWPLTATGAGTLAKVSAFPGSYVSYTSVSPDSSLVAVVQYTGTKVALYRAAAGGALSLVSTITANTPQAAAFSPDGSLLAVPTVDNTVSLWNVTDPARPVLAGTIAGLGSLPTYAAFANHSALLAVGTDAGHVGVWDVSNPSQPVQRHDFGDPHAAIFTTTFSPDDQTLVAGGGDGLVWAWHLAGPDAEAYLGLEGDLGRVSDLRFLSGGSRLVAAGDNGTVRVWTATPAAAHQQLCATRGSILTAEEWSRYLPGVAVHDPC